MYLGWNNSIQQDSRGQQTERSLAEKELELLVDHVWDKRQQCALVAKAASSAMSCMSMSRGSRLRDIRVHLELSVRFWTLRYTNKLEWVQRRPEKGWGSWSRQCTRRGCDLGLFSMEKRSLQEGVPQKGRWPQTLPWCTVTGNRH